MRAIRWQHIDGYGERPVGPRTAWHITLDARVTLCGAPIPMDAEDEVGPVEWCQCRRCVETSAKGEK